MDKDTEEFEGGAGGSSISADLIRGHINTIILRSLYDRDKYGYEIINEINEKSHGQYTLKQPTLYSALKRLENQGYIQAYWKHEEASAGGRRKYFRLTESGRKVAETNRAEWEYSRTVIDNLISDKNFDFSQPAPTPVDFKILKQATSRVPVIHGEDDGNELEDGDVSAAAQREPAENEQEVTLVSGASDTVFIDDPSATAKQSDVQATESVADTAYNHKNEKEFAYSESILNDGTPPADDGFAAATGEDATQSQAAKEEKDDKKAIRKYVLVEDSPADFEILPIDETTYSPEEFAQSPVSATANAPDIFLQQPTKRTENVPLNYMHPTMAEAKSAPEVFLKDTVLENVSQAAEYGQPTMSEAADAPKIFIHDPDNVTESTADSYQSASTEEPKSGRKTFIRDPADETISQRTEPQPTVTAPENTPQDFVQPPTAKSESVAAEHDATKADEPIYSLPSQSYAQAVSHGVAADGTRYYSTAEERRIAHENYMKLIAGEPKRNSSEEDEDAKNLVYNLRSEQERDYKNLIDRLFDSTINNSAPSPVFQPEPIPQSQPEPDPELEPLYERTGYARTSFFDAGDKAAADGLKISTSDEAFAAGSAKQTTYNKGATLFKCSLIIGVIILLEFTLILLFRENIGVSLAYPIVILVLGMALVLVCGILYGTGYGINVRKPTSLRYIMTMTIITVIIIAIIFVAALVLGVNWTDGNDILAKMVLPFIITLNIPIFTLSFYLFTK